MLTWLLRYVRIDLPTLMLEYQKSNFPLTNLGSCMIKENYWNESCRRSLWHGPSPLCRYEISALSSVAFQVTFEFPSLFDAPESRQFRLLVPPVGSTTQLFQQVPTVLPAFSPTLEGNQLCKDNQSNRESIVQYGRWGNNTKKSPTVQSATGKTTPSAAHLNFNSKIEGRALINISL